jgi:mRNA-degrading endonuclease toxin of MazEF toxin-antitoxin module
MPQECVISLDNITPIVKALLIESITTLGPAKMQEVCRALNTAVDC